MSDLIGRLNAVDSSGDELGGKVYTNNYRNPDGPEAAQAITALTGQLSDAKTMLTATAEGLADATKRNAALTGQLKEAADIGERDGYEDAVQDIDIATGGDGEFFASTCEGSVDVQIMKQRIIDRVSTLTAENERLREALNAAEKAVINGLNALDAVPKLNVCNYNHAQVFDMSNAFNRGFSILETAFAALKGQS